MTQTYRVRYSLKPSTQHHGGADVETADVESDLEGIPVLLPAGAYIMYVEDLTDDRNVHWSRWPHSYRRGSVCDAIARPPSGTRKNGKW